MTADEEFWLSIVDNLDVNDVSEHDVSGVAGDTPLWVTKLATEVLTLVNPRLQLRVGDKASAASVGSLTASQLRLFAACRCFARLNAEQTKNLETAMRVAKPSLAGFDATAAISEFPQREARFHSAVGRVFPKILSRPPDEAFAFLRALSNGVRPSRSPSQRDLRVDQKRLRTLVVYGVTLMHWRTIDRLDSSQAAFRFLETLLPAEIVGYSAERVRRMFARLNKQFRAPGRPKKSR